MDHQKTNKNWVGYLNKKEISFKSSNYETSSSILMKLSPGTPIVTTKQHIKEINDREKRTINNIANIYRYEIR